jgi:hypothetical protein
MSRKLKFSKLITNIPVLGFVFLQILKILEKEKLKNCNFEK